MNLRPNKESFCPCCGSPAFTETELRIFTALATADREPFAEELMRMVQCSRKTVFRTAAALSRLITNRIVITDDGRRCARFRLTEQGHRLHRAICAGQIGVAAE